MPKAMQILIDSDAFIALSKIDDSNHKKAIEINKKLGKYSLSVVLSPFVIPETVTVMSNKMSHSSAQLFLQTVRKQSYLELDFNNTFKEKADQYFLNQNQKGTSYVDCSNMALMDLFNISAIFSFDKVYKKNGFKLIEEII